ncbi:NnrU family protein [Aquisalimonas sp.]|uniref:NnrU family protein n=1 Tax=Aquisalimonas sp. TaxID=1872621 RepID=UPI0025C312EF|nr:NnrU family protein [Aquisalimonas sp.]
MIIMIIGLLIFLGAHSVRVFAEDWRTAQIQRIGEGPWKGIYAVISVIGLALAIWGYGQMRLDPIYLWYPPMGLRHAVALLMIPAFVLLVATYVPRNHIQATLGHPMLLAVKLWALSHLLANGRVGDVVFFGAFLVWAILAFRAARRRDRAAQVMPPKASVLGTTATVVIGLVVYFLFAFYLHAWVTGVPALA